jgi:hypothetical protein
MPELLTLKVRYKRLDRDKSALVSHAVSDSGAAIEASSEGFRWAAAVAGFGLLLRASQSAATCRSCSSAREDGLSRARRKTGRLCRARTLFCRFRFLDRRALVRKSRYCRPEHNRRAASARPARTRPRS